MPAAAEHSSRCCCDVPPGHIALGDRDGRTRTDDSVVPGHVGCRSPTSRLSVRTVGFEPTISWPPARRDTRLRYALPSPIDPCGIRTQPNQLERLATSPEVERAVCAHSACLRNTGLFLEVGWKALESLSPGLQPGAKPSQLPAHLCALLACDETKKPGVLCVTPGFESSRKAQGRCHVRRGYGDSPLRKPVLPELPANGC